MSEVCRYAVAEAFLRGHDEDWAALIDLIGPCRPDPKVAQIVSFDPGQLRARGFFAAKVATIQAIGQGALDGVVPTRIAADQMDDEALITRLVSIKGVGRWTVEM